VQESAQLTGARAQRLLLRSTLRSLRKPARACASRDVVSVAVLFFARAQTARFDFARARTARFDREHLVQKNMKRAICFGFVLLTGMAVSSQRTQAASPHLRTFNLYESASAHFESNDGCRSRSMNVGFELFEDAQGNLPRTRSESINVSLYEENWCLGTVRSFGTFWPDLSGATFGASGQSGRLALRRSVELGECSYSGSVPPVCETRSVELSLLVDWTPSGDFTTSNFVRRNNLFGPVERASEVMKTFASSVNYVVSLAGEPLVFSQSEGQLTSRTNRSSTTP
jgi:hypothetical protein